MLSLFFGTATADLSKCTITECPAPGWLQKTGAANHSYSMEWEQVGEAVEYEVWYTKGSYVSPVQTTVQTSYTFNNLTDGIYTFYVQTVCPNGASSFIGNNDILEF